MLCDFLTIDVHYFFTTHTTQLVHFNTLSLPQFHQQILDALARGNEQSTQRKQQLLKAS